jgi:deoxycytidine triphosphate deaminase
MEEYNIIWRLKMFINPNEVIQNGWITGITDPSTQLQPNAIDFTLDELLMVNDKERAYISNNKKLVKMKQLLPINIINENKANAYWPLLGFRVYDGTSKMYVKVPAGYACVPMFTRSTLTRNGTYIMSGLYDSGYEGHIGFTIYTNGGEIDIEVGARIGQIGFVKAEHAHLYTGGYNHEQGTHYTTQAQVPPGQKQIPSDPRRVESGMGPILNVGSDFV